MAQNNNSLDKAKAYCIAQKERLTQPRLEVLKIIAKANKPLRAYEILDQLGKVIEAPKPPTAYRAIDFWQTQGFIHRIESLNAYVVCHAGHRHKGSQFMICDGCGTVIEVHLCEIPEALKESVNQKTFAVSSWNVEIHGRCVQCQAV